MIIPFAGGSASDVVSRIMFNKMSQSLGQPIIVENKPGAGGNSGTALAAKATPDGYTLVGAGSGPIAANLALYKNLGYDPLKELAIISPFASFTIVVTASNKLGVKTAQGTDRARQEGARRAELRLGRHRLVAASGRRILQPGDRREADPRALSQHRAVRARPDLRAGPARLPVVPERRRPDQRQRRDRASRSRATCGSRRCPTRRPRAQAGLPQYKVDGWFALAAPAGVPAPIMERLNKELNDALNDPAVKAGFEKAGAVPIGLGLEQAKKFHADEIVKYRDIITKAGIAKIE